MHTGREGKEKERGGLLSFSIRNYARKRSLLRGESKLNRLKSTKGSSVSRLYLEGQRKYSKIFQANTELHHFKNLHTALQFTRFSILRKYTLFKKKKERNFFQKKKPDIFLFFIYIYTKRQ